MRVQIEAVGQERGLLAEESLALVVDILVKVAVDDQFYAHGPGERVEPRVAVRRFAQTLVGREDVGAPFSRDVSPPRERWWSGGAG